MLEFVLVMVIAADLLLLFFGKCVLRSVCLLLFAGGTCSKNLSIYTVNSDSLSCFI